MCKKLIYFIENVSVEPTVFLALFGCHILDFVNTNLFLQKTCRWNQTTEPDLSTECDDKKQGILFVSKINSNYRPAVAIALVMYLILATCWSDEAGRRRRPLIFIPILGLILTAISGCLHSYFWTWIPISAVLSKYFFEVTTGGDLLLAIACQMYICDATNIENRTMRLGFVWLAKTISKPVGKGAAGFVLRSVGFFYAYLFCLALFVTALTLGVVFIKDLSVPVQKKARFIDVINLPRVVNSFRVIFKNDVAHKRTIVLVLVLLNTLGWFALQGESTVTYLFLIHKFQWDERMYSTFQAFAQFGIILGTLFCSIVLSKLMKVHDGLIGGLASLCDTVASCGYLLASQSWQVFFASLFDIFHGSALSVSVSFMSKYYNSHEFGQLHAVLGVFSFLVTLSFPLYNIIFQTTIDAFPSAFYILSIVLNTLIFLMYCLSYFLARKMNKRSLPEKEQEPMMFQSPTAVVNHQNQEYSEITRNNFRS